MDTKILNRLEMPKSSCYQKGYTGDKYCEVCDETLQEGKAIPKLEHEYENDVCKNCGRVNNAQVDVTYSLTKTIDCPYTVFQFTAPESGDTHLQEIQNGIAMDIFTRQINLMIP